MSDSNDSSARLADSSSHTHTYSCLHITFLSISNFHSNRHTRSGCTKLCNHGLYLRAAETLSCKQYDSSCRVNSSRFQDRLQPSTSGACACIMTAFFPFELRNSLSRLFPKHDSRIEGGSRESYTRYQKLMHLMHETDKHNKKVPREGHFAEIPLMMTWGWS